MFCPKCGLEIQPGKKFCVLCGTQIEENSGIQSNHTIQYISQPTPQPTPISRATNQYTYKPKTNGKLKVFLIIAAIAVVFVLAVKNTSLGSNSSFEKALIKTLPNDLKIYNLKNPTTDEYSEYTLEVKELTIQKHVTNEKYDEAECKVVLEDENIKKTAYVILESIKYDDVGWCVEEWDYIKDSEITPKIEPDISRLKNEVSEFGFINTTVIQEDYNLPIGVFSLVHSVNSSHKYATFTGNISAIAEFFHSHDTRNMTGYASCGWNYSSYNDTKIQWNVNGNWELEAKFSSADLYPEKATLIINDNTGSSVYYYPRMNSNTFLGSYGSYNGGLDFSYEGNTIDDAQLTVSGYNSSIIFKPDSCTGYIHYLSDTKECYNLIRD